ncbi:hypothetical protein [Kitasatospora sp. GAS204B]|nr:hypothetical protein [Kitasatospora sp. GAS204B]MDH6118930.1 anti-anti-sigma regulatory factor [Kitasatospora sp. GAS204B]
MDCAGLNIIVAARNQADLQGRWLVLRGGGHHAVRLLKLTGLHRHLTAAT